MAHILEFRSSAARPEFACEAVSQGGAQIIIFPGVRIERHADAEMEGQPKSRKRERARTKRDRLELPD
jgi:hypothetical protein